MRRHRPARGVVGAKYISPAICIAFVLAACAGAQTRPGAQDVPRGITIPQDATAIALRRQGEASTIQYQLRRVFPASSFLQDVNASLMSAGFTAMPVDWLNPTAPSSHSRGWTPFIDGTVTPNVRVHQWLAQWQDKDGNVVVYALRYRSAYDESPGSLERPDNDQLAVAIAWIPAAQAKTLMNLPVPSETNP